MNEEERNRFNELATEVVILRRFLIELCRPFTEVEIDEIITPLRFSTGRKNPEIKETLDRALRKFKVDLMTPRMDG